MNATMSMGARCPKMMELAKKIGDTAGVDLLGPFAVRRELVLGACGEPGGISVQRLGQHRLVVADVTEFDSDVAPHAAFAVVDGSLLPLKVSVMGSVAEVARLSDDGDYELVPNAIRRTLLAASEDEMFHEEQVTVEAVVREIDEWAERVLQCWSADHEQAEVRSI